MNKELIERIALEEVMWSLLNEHLWLDDRDSTEKPSVVEFAFRLVKRLDAELGKEAVGEIYALHELNDQWASKLPVGTKLFLSPTIPEGRAQRSAVAEECAMLCDALAAKAEDAARDCGYYSKEFASAYEFAAADIRANIAAAQGELNE